ncbi:peroxide stress protein YaaA [Chitinimonas sp. BJB300]|uniref:peroxide stress protein YaaA n=1 Tax=Chitinimonas sp. BJB300 TaxID=1559339 RepID=UPI000C0CC886|nr:peroxide stress protein YaaA [Chitinimonas sp. BJB300]PHV10283.1 peroxide stress protein YaaA [Chitinimonas sp. BJB300]TSJ84786.1 peroxide stress protein YaaA [Chitinimonas sp. BJB300]
MLFVISPAKTLDFDTPAQHEHSTLPAFIPQSTQLIETLRQQSPADIAKLMTISDNLAALNVARYQDWSPRFTSHNSKPAVLAFMGDVYEGLDAASLDSSQIKLTQQRLRILSGLYGLLRPLDLMQPYRLEMGTRLANPHGNNLYAFWGNTITDALNAELARQAEPVLVNLASEEYFKSVKRKQLKGRLVDCVFEDNKNGQYKVISFYAKRARGLMVRYAMLNQIDRMEDLKNFDLEGYRFASAESTSDKLVFRRRLVA